MDETKSAGTAVLKYGTEEMKPAPINTTLDAIVTCLEQGHHPVIVELEPGDGTYYNLLIVPSWAVYVAPHLRRFGILADRAIDYLIVTRLTDQEGQAFYATAQVGPWDLHGIDNEWSRELLAWWLRETLWPAINQERERR